MLHICKHLLQNGAECWPFHIYCTILKTWPTLKAYPYSGLSALSSRLCGNEYSAHFNFFKHHKSRCCRQFQVWSWTQQTGSEQAAHLNMKLRHCSQLSGRWLHLFSSTPKPYQAETNIMVARNVFLGFTRWHRLAMHIIYWHIRTLFMLLANRERERNLSQVAVPKFRPTGKTNRKPGEDGGNRMYSTLHTHGMSTGMYSSTGTCMYIRVVHVQYVHTVCTYIHTYSSTVQVHNVCLLWRMVV